MTTPNDSSGQGHPVAGAPLSEGLGPRCIECDGLVQWRCPTCAIRSQRAPLYTQDELDAAVAEVRERWRLFLIERAAVHLRAAEMAGTDEGAHPYDLMANVLLDAARGGPNVGGNRLAPAQEHEDGTA